MLKGDENVFLPAKKMGKVLPAVCVSVLLPIFSENMQAFIPPSSRMMHVLGGLRFGLNSTIQICTQN